MVMGVGASTPKKTSDYSPVDQGDGGTRPLAEQTGLGDGVKELPRYGTFFEIPDHLEIPKMRLRDDGVFVSGLPDELDPQRRERYERALFRLFFQRALYERGGDGRPPTFMVSEGTLVRDIAKRTIGFADHVMRYVESTCGIEPKRFLDAAVKYTESWVDADQPRSVLGLV